MVAHLQVIISTINVPSKHNVLIELWCNVSVPSFFICDAIVLVFLFTSNIRTAIHCFMYMCVDNHDKKFAQRAAIFVLVDA